MSIDTLCRMEVDENILIRVMNSSDRVCGDDDTPSEHWEG